MTSSPWHVLPLVAALLISPAAPGARAAASDVTWQSIEPAIFGGKAIADDGGVVSLEAPVRAEDAALVPVTIRLAVSEGDARRVTGLTLVVDENPSPLVARFTFGAGVGRFDLSTRIRVNAYSFVRAVAELSDGSLHMTKAYVKAAGGCSAPAAKDPADAKVNAGKMRFRVFADRGEAQLQLRHPNNSGMQMDQVTRLYTPAWFIEELTITQGERPILAMEGGISLSEDPTFRFAYRDDGGPVTVEAKDTEGNRFRQTFAAGGS